MHRHLPLCLVLFATAAEAKPPAVAVTQATPPDMSGLILRAAPDTDPTEYMGGFVMEEGFPDETAATKLQCSSYVSYKEVDAGANETSDYFAVSASLAAKLGFPPLLMSGGMDSGATMLVAYTHTKTWQAKVADPGGFSQCCATYPGECREYYIGDFIGGTGRVYMEQVMDAKGKALVVSPVGTADVKASGGKNWVFTKEFKNEVAFAYKLKKAPLNNATTVEDPICKTDWENNPPNDMRGHWESAVSDVYVDLAGAKANGYDHAAAQVAKWCGIDVSVEGSGSRTDSSGTSAPSSTITGGSSWSATSAAIVKQLRTVCTRTETADSPRGVMYRYRGLYLLPTDKVDQTCADAKTSFGSGGSGKPAVPTSSP